MGAEDDVLWNTCKYIRRMENRLENLPHECTYEVFTYEHGTHFAFETADATNQTYQKEQFDVVVIANALHIMPDSDAVLKEIHRVLKKDGIVFAPTFVYEPGYSKILIWLMEKRYSI